MFITKRSKSEFELPSGDLLSKDDLLSRMGSCGWDLKFCVKVLGCLNDGGYWELLPSPSQAAILTRRSRPSGF